MIDRAALTAPRTPPETGASTYSMPCPASSSWTRTAAAVPMVEWSHHETRPSIRCAGDLARDRLRRPAVRHAQVNRLDPNRDRSVRCGGHRTPRCPRPGARRVVHHHFPPRLHEVGRHRPAHVAEADESERARCHAVPPSSVATPCDPVEDRPGSGGAIPLRRLAHLGEPEPSGTPRRNPVPPPCVPR